MLNYKSSSSRAIGGSHPKLDCRLKLGPSIKLIWFESAQTAASSPYSTPVKRFRCFLHELNHFSAQLISFRLVRGVALNWEPQFQITTHAAQRNGKEPARSALVTCGWWWWRSRWCVSWPWHWSWHRGGTFSTSATTTGRAAKLSWHALFQHGACRPAWWYGAKDLLLSWTLVFDSFD